MHDDDVTISVGLWCCSGICYAVCRPAHSHSDPQVVGSNHEDG